MATATYIANNQFHVSGDRTEYLREGQKLLLDQGVDGTPDVTVASFTYNSGETRTEVTIEEDTITANLTDASNSDNIPANTPKHLHPEIPANALSQEEVDFLQAIQIPTDGDDNKIARVTDTEDGLELVDLEGTEDQITVEHDAGKITLVLEQNIDTEADVEFGTLDVDDITLNNQTGILEAKADADLITAHSSNTALQIFRRNAANDGYEFASVKLEELGDSDISSPAQDDIIVRDDSGKWANVAKGEWPNALVMGLDGHVAWGNAGVVVEGTAGEALSQYDVVYTDSSDSGKWKKAQQDGSAAEAQARGVVIESGGIADDATGTILLFGLVTNGAYSWTPGATLYLSDTAGTLQESVPGSGNIIICGQAQSATQILFTPPDTASQTAHGGDHEYDGSDPITGANLELTKSATNYTPTSNTLGGHQEGINTALGLAAGAVAIPAPDWTPPAFQRKDNDEIWVEKGRYWKGKHRFRGQYQSLPGLAAYFDVATKFAVDVDATYSQGSTSGMIDGAKVNEAWYSVWMMDNDELLILPYIRVYAVDYDVSHAGKTTINPGDHFTGLSGENGFILSADAFNDYQLQKLAIESEYDGEMFTIEDTVNGTPDEIIIDGDQTAYIVAKNWFQLIPPAATDCVYLGDIPIDGDGYLGGFKRTGWRYQLTETNQSIDATLSATTPGNADMAPAMSPATRIAHLNLYANGTSCSVVRFFLCNGITGTDRVKQVMIQSSSGTNGCVGDVTFVMTATGLIRNYAMKDGISGADNGRLEVAGFEL